MINKNWERLHQDVELVCGTGDRRKLKLCIMSFAALLAGEDHTDRPESVSRLIRSYAVIINDEMPASRRNDLKPFAIRLVGTNDRRDYDRIALLFDIVKGELLPRIEDDFPARNRTRFQRLFGLTEFGNGDMTVGIYQQMLASCGLPRSSKEGLLFAAGTAKLLSACGNSKLDIEREWYWSKAIDILDQFCTLSDFDGSGKSAAGPNWLPLPSETHASLITNAWSKIAERLGRTMPFLADLPFH